jgi:hypothetical protein
MERCRTHEEDLQYRSMSFARLTESWAPLDAAMRNRKHKQPESHGTL